MNNFSIDSILCWKRLIWVLLLVAADCVKTGESLFKVHYIVISIGQTTYWPHKGGDRLFQVAVQAGFTVYITFFPFTRILKQVLNY